MIRMNSAWSKQLKKFATANVAKKIDESLIRQAMQKAVMTARDEIDKLVYDAPLPASAGADYVRTGATRRAIRKGEMPKIEGVVGKVTGEVLVDPDMANREGFFYPYILNRGRTDINYAARPFWRNTKIIMAAWFRQQGRRVLVEIRDLYKP